MWGCSPNHVELLGLAARETTRDDAPLPAGAAGLRLPRDRAQTWKIGLGAWREMTERGSRARAACAAARPRRNPGTGSRTAPFS